MLHICSQHKRLAIKPSENQHDPPRTTMAAGGLISKTRPGVARSGPSHFFLPFCHKSVVFLPVAFIHNRFLEFLGLFGICPAVLPKVFYSLICFYFLAFTQAACLRRASPRETVLLLVLPHSPIPTHQARARPLPTERAKTRRTGSILQASVCMRAAREHVIVCALASQYSCRSTTCTKLSDIWQKHLER